MKLYPFQQRVLDETKELNRVAYYLDMGLGKTFVGSEKAMQLGRKILVICQKSKVDDWINHFQENYKYEPHFAEVVNLTEKDGVGKFYKLIDRVNEPNWITDELTGEEYASTPLDPTTPIGVINYELAFRRPELTKLQDFTLMLDESSLIQNENAKRSKFILNRLSPTNLILLSGTPTSGKYEKLWSQIHLLGWKISKDLYWRQYVDVEYLDNQGFPLKIVKGYKNVDRLKSKLREHGAVFMKTEEVFELPEQVFQEVKISTTKEYRKFKKDRIITIGEKDLVGDTVLTKMLYERMLCGQYNAEKIKALQDLLESTEDRVIIFYNFNEELKAIEDMCIELDKPVSIVNGQEKDLSCYEEYDNAVTIIQYQAGSMGLNLQKSNKIIYFTPTLSSELYEQSKKRTHRLNQGRACFYYTLVCKNSIEEHIYDTLKMRKDYNDDLFREMERNQ